MSLAENLAGCWGPSTLFSQTIPSLSSDEPAVRYAAIAVGALGKAVSSSRSSGTTPSPPGSSPHYSHAVTYYGRALRLVRVQQDTNSDDTLRVAIIACILFACFEILHDSFDSGINHINHGLMIVDQFLCNQNTTTLRPDADKRKQRAVSPCPRLLDQDILQFFQRLEYLIWTTQLLQQPPPAPSRIYLRRLQPFQLRDRPFSDILEARTCLDSAQHHVLRVMAASSPTSLDMAPLEQWHQAFEPLYARTCSTANPDSSAYLQSASLLLQYHSAWLSFQAQSSNIGHQDMPRFKEILRLSEVILTSQSRETFSMDHGPTLPLFLAATKCVEQSVREEAARLLREYPRRDALWDTRNVLALI